MNTPLDDFRWTCWSCQEEFEPGCGISVDDTDEEQICRACWKQISPTSRLVLGLLFRRLHAGGFGIKDALEDAIAHWPFPGRDRPSNN